MLRTACYPWHVAHGGRMVDFAGWEMPVQFASIVQEHHAVRRAAGLFDIAHMGRLKFTGPDACRLLDHLLTNDVSRLEPSEIRYALVTNESGGILDDVLVYRFETFYLLVVNASNRAKIVQWIDAHRASFDAAVDDRTVETFMLAIQGPQACAILAPLVDANIGALPYYYGCETNVLGHKAIVSRTGYTGEDGFEVILASTDGPAVWQRLIDDGHARGLAPCGLGARDTLRLEAGMPLYGHELDESIDPITAGLSFGVKLDKDGFIGESALAAVKTAGATSRRVGVALSGKRIAREGAAVFLADQQIGKVTSGTFSPTLEKPIAMAYVPREAASPGTVLDVDIRGKREGATVVKLPFYRRGS